MREDRGAGFDPVLVAMFTAIIVCVIIICIRYLLEYFHG